MIIKGRAHKFGDDINTDDIIAAKYLNTTDPKELGSHCMETIAPDFVSKIKDGDIIVAGRNFGCGSSREHAPMAIKGCGISLVIAKSFARIFFRNSINTGLPILELKQIDEIGDGDEITVDLEKGIVENATKNKKYILSGYPSFMQDIVVSGGLMKYIERKGRDEDSKRKG